MFESHLLTETVGRIHQGRTREDPFAWLEETSRSEFEPRAELLKLLFETDRRLPDRAQYRPAESVFAEADFYYERDNRAEVCFAAALITTGPSGKRPIRGSEAS